jgi:hypothetical protein
MVLVLVLSAAGVSLFAGTVHDGPVTERVGPSAQLTSHSS